MLPMSSMNTRDIAGANIKAQRFADSEAKRILTQERAIVQRIVALFREENPSHVIVSTLGNELHINADGPLKFETTCGIVLRIIQYAVPTRERQRINSAIRKTIFEQRCRKSTTTGRNSWMEENEMVVFSDAQTEQLFYFRSQQEFKIPPRYSRCDNEKIATAMNQHFQTTKFTKDNCRQRAANVTLKHRKASAKASRP